MGWRRPWTLGLLGLALLAGCTAEGATTPPLPPSSSATASPTQTGATTVAEGSLFRDTGPETPGSGTIRRSRPVTLDTSLLLDGAGKARRGPVDLTLNLFPDVTYRTRVTLTSLEGGADVWEGTLTGRATSSVMILRVNGVFIMKAASPAGVFEVSSVAGGYRVIEMNQAAMPTEG